MILIESLSNFEADRTKIAEVRAEWNFCRCYIMRFEPIALPLQFEILSNCSLQICVIIDHGFGGFPDLWQVKVLPDNARKKKKDSRK